MKRCNFYLSVSSSDRKLGASNKDGGVRTKCGVLLAKHGVLLAKHGVLLAMGGVEIASCSGIDTVLFPLMRSPSLVQRASVWELHHTLQCLLTTHLLGPAQR